MIKHYFKIVLRNLWRNKIYSFINIFGLTLGLICFLLIALYVFDELTYDSFHKNSNNIYRVIETKVSPEGKESKVAAVGYKVAEQSPVGMPEVKKAARFSTFGRTNVSDPAATNAFYEAFSIANPEFLQVFDFKLIEGDRATALTAPRSVILTEETARKIFGVSSVVKPVQQPIEPMIIGLNRWGGFTVVRTQPDNTETTIKALKKISTELNPTYPFSFGFLDQDIANLYKGDQRMGSLFNVFAILAIFISCMGLYGLSAFMAEQRTKEIGVRKVLGSSVFNVVYLLSSGFTKLIFISVVIAVPIAWYVINSWLKSFAFRVSADWVIFLSASLAALTIAWITVSYESIKAAIANPVKSLRTE